MGKDPNKFFRKQQMAKKSALKTYNNFLSQYRPNELISPSLSRYSYISLVKKIHKHLFDVMIQSSGARQSSSSNVSRIKIDPSSHFATATNLHNTRNIDTSVLESQIRNAIPDHLIHDIFLLYYLPDDVIKINSSRNLKKYEIIHNIYNGLIKIITEKQTVNAYYITEVICEYLLALYANQDKKTCQALSELFSGENYEDLSPEQQKSLNEFINKIGKTKISKIKGNDSEHQSQSIEQMMNEAADKADGTNKAYTELGIKSPSLSDYDNSHFNFENLEIVRKLTSGMILSKDSISQMFNLILNKFRNEFSTNYDLKLSELIEDPEEFVDIMDLEYFANNRLLSLFLDEIMVTTKKPRGKVDLYIDASGSMGSSTDANSRMVIAKGVAIKFIKYKLVRNVYFFADKVSKPYNSTNLYEILIYDNGGGTSFNRVLEQVKKENKHSIVITDGEDYANYFDSKVHWIGVGDADFTTFIRNEESKKFLDNGRCFYYNGHKLVKHHDSRLKAKDSDRLEQKW